MACQRRGAHGGLATNYIYNVKINRIESHVQFYVLGYKREEWSLISVPFSFFFVYLDMDKYLSTGNKYAYIDFDRISCILSLNFQIK